MPSLTNSIEIQMYKLMLLTRRVEERMNQLFRAGLMKERPHSAIGQEAVGVASAISLRPEDLVMPSLRGRAVFITKGVPLHLIFADAFSKAEGSSGGKWTSHHMCYPETGVLLGSAIVGGSLPVAVGAALAMKYKGLDRVTIAYFGDGATSRGDFHESLNLASVMDLPIIFICENNLYAISTPIYKQMKIKDVAMRGHAYGIPSISIDGNDTGAIYQATVEAIAQARANHGPSFIECKTYRWRGHTELYSPEQGRPKEELSSWMERCPIQRLEASLRERTLLDDTLIEEIQINVHSIVENAIEKARGMSQPEITSLYTNVYY